MTFRDRKDAGRRLAARLRGHAGPRPVVIALPRGGVPVAAEVARSLHAPLDVVIVRKLGCPWQPELGLGAIGEGGIRLLNRDLVAQAGVTEGDLEEVSRRETAELERRARRYRDDRPPLPVEGRAVVLVDDGIATGFTARAAVEVLRHRGAARIVLAVPVAPPDTVAELRRVADEVVALETPVAFWAIGTFYDDFAQTTDEEVADALRAAGTWAPSDQAASGGDTSTVPSSKPG